MILITPFCIFIPHEAIVLWSTSIDDAIFCWPNDPENNCLIDREQNTQHQITSNRHTNNNTNGQTNN
jgi:hypothetical protein